MQLCFRDAGAKKPFRIIPIVYFEPDLDRYRFRRDGGELETIRINRDGTLEFETDRFEFCEVRAD